MKPMWIDIQMGNAEHNKYKQLPLQCSSQEFNPLLASAEKKGQTTKQEGHNNMDFDFLGFCPT
jgi:hypothetical protein